MRFLFVCGGTAGHINPALALAEKLRELVPGCEILFVGTGREMENRLIPAEGYKIVNIKMTGFSRSISLGGLKYNLETVKNILVSLNQSKKIIRDFRPDVAIGTGGYVCYPVLKTAARMGIPTVLHESNAIPGLTTKMLASTVDDMLVAFPAARDNYKKKDNIRVVGTPVRGEFDKMTKAEAKKLIGVGDRKLVVSFWGSLGAEHMNEVIADFIRRNTENLSFEHIHATGGGTDGLEAMKKRLFNIGASGYNKVTDLRAYINNMGVVMKAADIVMCRAGASTIAELTLLGVPSILVPSPNVTNNHQEINARALESSGASKMILEKGCGGESLYNTVVSMLSDENELKKLSYNAKKLGVPDSSGVIADIILSHVKLM